jgi:hypothetical protein
MTIKKLAMMQNLQVKFQVYYGENKPDKSYRKEGEILSREFQKLPN